MSTIGPIARARVAAAVEAALLGALREELGRPLEASDEQLADWILGIARERIKTCFARADAADVSRHADAMGLAGPGAHDRA